MPTKKFNTGLALLKLLAAWGIVGCHLNMRPATPAGASILHFTDTNVILFGILSGYFLVSSQMKSEGAWAFVCKKAQRLLPVYVAWSIFHLCIKFGLDFAVAGHLSESFKDPGRWYYIVFWGDAAAHLWYVISLFYISVALYPLRRWLCWAWPVLATAAFVWVIKGWGGYYGWYPGRLLASVLVGVGLWHCELRLKQISFEKWAVIFAVCVGLHLFAPWRALLVVYDVLVSVPLVMLALQWPTRIPSWLVELSKCSFGVYLVHVSIAFAIGTLARKILPSPYNVEVIAKPSSVELSGDFVA